MSTYPSLIDEGTKIRVSSTLERGTGRKGLTDRNEETCWTSAQGSPQHITIVFPTHILLHTLHMTFQGGFSGKRCRLLSSPTASPSADELAPLASFHPQDVNRSQEFRFDGDGEGVGNGKVLGPFKTLRIVFDESSDFFGRITVYDLDVRGVRLEGEGEA